MKSLWLKPAMIPFSQPPVANRSAFLLPFLSALLARLKPRKIIDWGSSSPFDFFALCHAAEMTGLSYHAVAFAALWEPQWIRWAENYRVRRFPLTVEIFYEDSSERFSQFENESQDLVHVEWHIHPQLISKLNTPGLLWATGTPEQSWRSLAHMGPSCFFPWDRGVGLMAPGARQHDLIFELRQNKEFYQDYFSNLGQAFTLCNRWKRLAAYHKKLSLRLMNDASPAPANAVMDQSLMKILGLQGQIHYSLSSMEKKIAGLERPWFLRWGASKN